MKAWALIGETCTPDGNGMTLTKRDEEYVVLLNGKTLMSSRMHGSEEALATAGCQHLRTAERARVLVGGLGMGFTLRAALDALPGTPTSRSRSWCRPWSSGTAGPLGRWPGIR